MGTALLNPLLARLAVLAAALPLAGAAIGCDGLGDGPDGVVAEVIDGNTIRLDSGIVVRLSGIVAPMPAGRKGAPAEPMAAAAKAALTELVASKAVRLALEEEETDRYGRMEAQLYLSGAGGMWVQQGLVARGAARVYVMPTNRRCVDELIAAETVARANGVGIWADPYYSVRDAGDPAALAGREGHYELIEGNVLDTGETRDRVYLDFGRVWKEDTTATVDRKALARFTAAGIDPLKLGGQRVRIRGWLESRDGPLIELAVPEQIEVISPK